MRNAIIILFLGLAEICCGQTFVIVYGDTTYYTKRMTAGLEKHLQFSRLNADGRYLVYAARHLHEPSDTLLADFGWKNGDYAGHCRWWNSAGKLTVNYTLDENGTYHGPYMDHGRDGTKLRIGSYNHGQKHGEWLNYDRAGKLYLRQVFDNDCPTESEYWKYEVILPDAERKTIKQMNKANREKRFKRKGEPKLMSFERTVYSSCVIRERSLFDPKGRLLETVTFPEK